ncbi:methionine ABC transporter permease [Reinekea sp.]|uniref:methionine ABC transporter permease n=1 Tax=Reinekea sp. TaxID=1970455 RepID=UPI00398929B5
MFEWYQANQRLIWLLIESSWETVAMVLASGFFSVLFGLPVAVLLRETARGGLFPHALTHKILSTVVNVGRSIPFIILLVAIIPFTRWLVGTSIGTVATIVPLAVAAIPFVARLFEGALMEVPSGLTEAAKAMGANSAQIVWKVQLPEALPGIINAITITLVTLVSYSAMAGVVGGGGLGDVGIRYGYQRFDAGVMLITIALLVAFVQFIQTIGDALVHRVNHRE